MSMPVSQCACSALDLITLTSGSATEAEFRRLQPGDVAWDASTGDGKVLVVREGLVRVYHGPGEGRMRLTHVLGPGRWCGAESLAGVKGLTRAVAAEASLVALISAEQVIEQAMAKPQSGKQLLRHLAEQLANAQYEVTETRYFDCASQVVRTLLRLGRCGAATRNEGGSVTLQLTQQDIADAVGIARETVNALLQKLAEQGLVTKQRGRITFDENALVRWAEAHESGSAAGA